LPGYLPGFLISSYSFLINFLNKEKNKKESFFLDGVDHAVKVFEKNTTRNFSGTVIVVAGR
jgi:hypothetical protein